MKAISEQIELILAHQEAASRVQENKYGPESGIDLESRALIIGRESGRYLAALVRNFRASRIADLGAGIGYTSLWLLSALDSDSQSRLFSVDQDPARVRVMEHNRNFLGDSRWMIQCERAEDYLTGNIGGLDLVVIDTWKDSYEPIVQHILQMNIAPRVVVLDNLISPYSTREKVQQAWTLLVKSTLYQCEIVKLGNGLGVATLASPS